GGASAAARCLDLAKFWAERCQANGHTGDMQRGSPIDRDGRILKLFATYRKSKEVQREMWMNTRAAGIVLAGLSALMLLGPVTTAGADELSEKAVKSFMEYAWSLTPQQFSKPDGSVVIIDKTKKSQVLVPIDVARN